VDDHRFDHLTRILATGVPRRLVTSALASGISIALLSAAAEDTAGKKKRNKRRKRKPKASCRTLRQECDGNPGEQCCNGLICDDNTCVGDPVCVQPTGGSCRDKCDCRLGLECSDRADNTCQQCALLQNPCDSHDDCCLLSAACGSNIFTSGVCCQQLGAACGLDSDCCANTGKCGLDGGGGTAPVCCKGMGLSCASNGDCCDPLRCVNGSCQ
jgi:hypothetical protein